MIRNRFKREKIISYLANSENPRLNEVFAIRSLVTQNNYTQQLKFIRFIFKYLAI